MISIEPYELTQTNNTLTEMDDKKKVRSFIHIAAKVTAYMAWALTCSLYFSNQKCARLGKIS